MYREGRERLSELVLSLSNGEVGATVPACPRWTVRDVVAHLAGICADALAGNMEGVTTEPWADVQVAGRSDRTIGELVEEWSRVAPEFEAAGEEGADRGTLRTLWVLDLAAHEQDVRGAVGRPGARTWPGIEASLEFLVTMGLHRQLADRSLGPLAVRTPGGRVWTIGAEGPAPAATLDVPGFDLFRALTGRRSAAQICGWAWSADPAPFMPAFQFGPFTMAAADLAE